jgi:mannosyltransferase OCH1-like enzyme
MCILSWKDKLPDHEIIEWTEKNFPLQEEFVKCRYLEQCYKRKLWAFVSDYMRVHVLSRYGGIYLDTDIYLVKSLQPLANNNDSLDHCFMGFECNDLVNLAIAGSPPDNPLWDDMLCFYREEIWSSNMFMIPQILTSVLQKNYALELNGKEQILKNTAHIYPREFFYPYYYDEEFSPECVATNTYSIHWWSSSWKTKKNKGFLKTKHLTGWRKWLKAIQYKLPF